MQSGQCYAEDFRKKYPEGNFFNLKRSEDISTIYHQEYEGRVEGDMNYWCLPPAGFKHHCDFILGVFGESAGLAIGVRSFQGKQSYIVLTRNDDSFPELLKDCGVKPNHPYTEAEISNIAGVI